MSKSKNEKLTIQIAERMAHRVRDEDDNFSIDPLTIIALINVIIGLVRIIIECRKNREDAKGMIRKPGIIARYLMKREIRKQFPAEHRRAIYKAMLEVGPSLTDKEVDSVFNYVNKELCE